MQNAASLNKKLKMNIKKHKPRFFRYLLVMLLLVLVPACSAAEEDLLAENEPGFGAVKVSDMDGMEQVYISAGAFFMGKNYSYNGETSRKNEASQHQVKLPGFWIDKTEVTGDMYALFLSDTLPKDETLDEYLSRTSCFSYSSFKKRMAK